jgi:hypothetical protein
LELWRYSCPNLSINAYFVRNESRITIEKDEKEKRRNGLQKHDIGKKGENPFSFH